MTDAFGNSVENPVIEWQTSMRRDFFCLLCHLFSMFGQKQREEDTLG